MRGSNPKGRGGRGRKNTYPDDFPLFAQIPVKLLKEKRINRSARLLFCVYHSFCQEKDLTARPSTFVSQKNIALIMGCSPRSIYEWNTELVTSGWITTKPRGWRGLEVILHGKPLKRLKNRTTREKEMVTELKRGNVRNINTVP